MKVEIGNATLFHGDCLEILPTLPKVDAVITDPPYGVLLGEVDNGQARERNRRPYAGFSDTPEYLRNVCAPAVAFCIEKFGRVVATVGTRNAWEYPKPDDIGCWYNPAGNGISRWGFLTAHPILYWGKDPRRGSRQITANSVTGFSPGIEDRDIDHPCPKPISFMRWMVAKGSLDGEFVLDPFMGSGTTGVACMNLGRKFIGIEIEKKYFDIACERIDQAQRQGRMFA